VMHYYLLQIPMAKMPNVGLVFDTESAFDLFSEKIGCMAESSLPRPGLCVGIFKGFVERCMEHVEFLVDKVARIVGRAEGMLGIFYV
jgi:hypothetical protein